jgi:hypothetical protein
LRQDNAADHAGVACQNVWMVAKSCHIAISLLHFIFDL